MKKLGTRTAVMLIVSQALDQAGPIVEAESSPVSLGAAFAAVCAIFWRRGCWYAADEPSFVRRVRDCALDEMPVN